MVEEEFDVVIVGAGVSGLTAASTLLSHNPQLRIKIFEASDRPGGRVKSLVDFSRQHNLPYCLEAGAEWIHGESLGRYQSILYEGITQYVEKNAKGVALGTENGSRLIEYKHAGDNGGDSIQECYHISQPSKRGEEDSEIGEGVGRLVRYPAYWDNDLERVEDFIDNLWKYQPNNSKGSAGRKQRGNHREKEEKKATKENDYEVNTEESVAEYFYKHILKMSPPSNTPIQSVFSSVHNTPTDQRNQTWRNHHLLEAWLGTDFGTSIERLGMHSLAVSERLWRVGEKDFVLRNGHSYWDTLCEVFEWNDRILNRRSQCGSPAHIVQYNTCVTAINYTDESVLITTASPNSPPEMASSVHRCRRVIVTVPLTMLKQRRILFTPPLPESTQRAIDRIGMDNAGMKIHIGFRERFWGERVHEITLKTTTAFAWDPSFYRDNSRVEAREKERRGKKDTKRNSKEKVNAKKIRPTGSKSDLATSSGEETCSEPPSALHVLVFMITGSTAEELSKLTDDQKATLLLKELDELFNGAASHYFEPSLVHVQDWGREPFIAGCYSYPSPSSYSSAVDNDRIELSKAIVERVWIAGEAVALFHPATVLGAMESGKCAGENIILTTMH